MPRPGVKLGKQKQNLSVFGKWVDTLCSILSTTQPQIAKRAGMDMSTVSRVTREDPARDVHVPSEETVQKLWRAFKSLADEQGILLSEDEMLGFYNAGGYTMPAQIDASLVLLEAFLQRRERDRERLQEIEKLRLELQEKEELIQRLQRNDDKEQRS